LDDAGAGYPDQKGTLSRAEVTDAAMRVRAECVMVNKGPRMLKSSRKQTKSLAMAAALRDTGLLGGVFQKHYVTLFFFALDRDLRAIG
jgi:hypothetical protein